MFTFQSIDFEWKYSIRCEITYTHPYYLLAVVAIFIVIKTDSSLSNQMRMKVIRSFFERKKLSTVLWLKILIKMLLKAWSVINNNFIWCFGRKKKFRQINSFQQSNKWLNTFRVDSHIEKCNRSTFVKVFQF